MEYWDVDIIVCFCNSCLVVLFPYTNIYIVIINIATWKLFGLTWDNWIANVTYLNF